ncbi:MAG TPA: geranylgeranylglyceryl/heptaprenylglyceryl phosphate synthase [Flavobacterium sp.]|nr:geranylgeranylglyceryl/heptaprenylglyceryl phosphate synthase [Flavobacterium sp.]
MSFLATLQSARQNGRKLLAVLLDPDKLANHDFDTVIHAVNQSPATHVFVGGSRVAEGRTTQLVAALKQGCQLPVILFPGHPSQVCRQADALLLLSLVSGRNPDYLIGHHVQSAKTLKDSGLEISPTGYLLIDGGKKSAVEEVTSTPALTNDDEIVSTALASQLLGHQLVYLEAGSGAARPVLPQTIGKVARELQIPVIAGGGIRSKNGISDAHQAGATLVVIGTAFEENLDFFNQPSIAP